MAAPGSLQGPARPPAGLSPPDSAATAATRSEKSQFPHCTVRFTRGKSHFPGRAAGCAWPQPGPLPQGTEEEEQAASPPRPGAPFTTNLRQPLHSRVLAWAASQVGARACPGGKAALRGGETCPAASVLWPLQEALHPASAGAPGTCGGEADYGVCVRMREARALQTGSAFPKVLTPKGQGKRRGPRESAGEGEFPAVSRSPSSSQTR